MAHDSKQNSLESTASSSSRSSFKFVPPISKSSPISNGYTPSEWVSRKVAQAMILSDFGLSLFECPLNRHQADVVCSRLVDLNCKISAVWVVARPLNYNNDGKFQHWCIKIQAPPSLISLDFLEVKKMGYIRYEATVASQAELKDFLYFYYSDPNSGRRIRKKWKILASVTPSPLADIHYLEYLDDYDVKTLTMYMSQSQKKKNHKHNKNKDDEKYHDDHKHNDFNPLLKNINCKKRACDIAEFISMWTSNNNIRQSISNGNGKKGRGYHPIISNCQQFVADLFHWLIGAQVMYIYKYMFLFIMYIY